MTGPPDDQTDPPAPEPRPASTADGVPEWIGHYRVERELGRGGMGVVLLARDTRLDRPVAVKALPDAFATHPDRLARFRREARLLASIHHPNIATVFGLEEQRGAHYLVLEHIEGRTLSDVLDAGPPPIDDATAIARDVARALEAAHARAVIHRDLKPSNVMLAADGSAKVLDFGLARSAADGNATTTPGSSAAPADAPAASHPSAADDRSSELDTLTTAPTAFAQGSGHTPTVPGAVLGTAPYMSPEQARGKPVDHRTDVWSFGVLLYELLTGVGPFGGDTAADSIAAILHAGPDLDALPADTPPGLRRVLARCLERDPDRRYQHMGDARLDLEESSLADAARSAGEPVAERRGWAGPAVAAMAAAAAVLAGGIGWFARPDPPTPEPPVVDAALPLPDGLRVAHGFERGVAFAPGGDAVVLPVGAVDPDDWLRVTAESLAIRRLGGPGLTRLPDTAGATDPVFSPDGARVAFVTGVPGGAIRSAPAGGGPPITLADDLGFLSGLAWSPDGRIVFGGPFQQLRAIPEGGGEPTPLTSIDADRGETGHQLPHALPDGSILFTVTRFGYPRDRDDSFEIWALDADTGERHEVLAGFSSPRVSGGTLFAVRDRDLFAAPFDLENLRTAGPPRRVLETVMWAVGNGSNTGEETGAAVYDVSSRGDLVFAPGGDIPPPNRDLVRVDETGAETPIAPATTLYGVALLGDRRHLVFTTAGAEPGVATFDLERGITRRRAVGGGTFLPFPGPGPDRFSYDYRTADGSRVLRTHHVDSDEPDDRTIELPESGSEGFALTLGWSHSGEHLLVMRGSEGERGPRWGLFARDPESGEESAVVPETSSRLAWPALSPDDRWITYTLIRPSGPRVFVRPFLREGPTVPVSSESAMSSFFAPSGDRLMLVRADDVRGAERALLEASFDEDEAGRPVIGEPAELFELPPSRYASTIPFRSFDALPGGGFVFVRAVDAEVRRELRDNTYPDRLRLITNWTGSLR